MKFGTLMTIGLLATACSKSASHKTEPPSTVPSATLSVAESASDGPAAALTPSAFPPLENACSKDAHCDGHYHYLNGDNRCCSSCTLQPGSKDWVRRVKDICANKSREGCPMKKCAGPHGIGCVDGRCVIRD